MSELRDIYEKMQAQQRPSAAGSGTLTLPDYQPTDRGSKELQEIYGRLYNAKKADFERNYAGIQEKIISAVQSAGNLYEDDVKAYTTRQKNNDKLYVGDSQQWYQDTVQKRATYDEKANAALQLIGQYEPFLNAEWVKNVKDSLSAMGRNYTVMSDNADRERQYWGQFPTELDWLRYTDPERAKELEPRPTWFQAGALEDGFSWSGLGQTIAGSAADLGNNLLGGLAEVGEKAVDALLYVAPYIAQGQYYQNGGGYNLQADALANQSFQAGKEGNEELIKKDLYDGKELASYITTKPLEAITGINADQASIFGDKSDALAQSGGQLLGTAALQMAGVPWWVTTGVATFGGETENALNQGATMEQAGLSAMVNTGAEILSEKLFGGSGLGEKGLINLEGLTKGISNKVVKSLLDFGVDMAAEGAEEVFSEVMGNLSSALYKEENLGQLLASEEALQGYLDAFVGGMVLSGVMNVPKATDSAIHKMDYRTGLTAEQQKVFDKAYSEALAQAQLDGTKLSGEQKRAIYDATLEAVKNGSIAGAGQVQQAESAQSGETAAAQDSTQLPQQTAQQAKPGTLEYVMELAQSGGLTNKQAQAVVDQPDLYQQVLELAGFESPATASGKRNAVKQAVAQIGQQQNTSNNQINIDNAKNVAYNNSINGGEQVERTAGIGEDQGRISGVYANSGADGQGRRERSGVPVGAGLVLLSPSSREILESRGVVNLELQDSSMDNAAFSLALDAARNADAANGWAVTPKTEKELHDAGVRTFMTANGSTGFAIAPDGDIEAVFANKAVGAPKGSTKYTIPLAIANGGTKLDCYGAGLVRLYAQYGFVPVARTAFNPEYANPGWTVDKGNPDIYFMMHNGESADAVVQNYGQYHIPTKEELDALPLMEYDNAYAYRDELLAQQKAQQGSQAARDGQILQTPTGTTQAPNEAQDLNARALGGNAVDTDGVRAQIRNNGTQLNAMQPVADIQVPAEFWKMDLAGKKNWIAEKMRSTGKVERKGFGVIELAIKKLKKAFGYFNEGDIEEAVFEAIPYVLQNGMEISSRDNHKGREYGTVTFAAPITVNGVRGNMAVVVKQTTGNFYKVHRVLSPDGSVFVVSEKTNEAESTTPGESPKNGSLATAKDSASLETGVAGNAVGHRQTQALVPDPSNSISQTDKNVNPDDSVGAAPAGFDPNSHLQYQYGTMPEGENPVRPDDLPNRDVKGNPISLSARTVKGAAVTPDSFEPLLNRQATGGALSYVPITNNATAQKAMDSIMQNGWSETLGAWEADVRNGKASAEMVATGALLLNNAAQAGDKATWLRVLHSYQQLSTTLGQGLQAMRILKTLDPSDKLYMIRRSVKQMAKDLGYKLEIDEDLARQYQEAETDTEADKILDTIAKDVAGQVKSTFGQKFTALRYLNMLGNLRTQVRNLSGNLTMGAMNKAKNAVAVGIETMANKASGGKVQKTKSLTVGKEQLRSAKADYDIVAQIISNGGRYNDPNAQRDLFAQKIADSKTVFRFKPLEGYRKATNWAMEKGDAIFSKAAYARSLAGYLKAKGYTTADYSQIPTAVMDDARLYAVKEAQEVTFRDNNWLSSQLSRLGRGKNSKAWQRVLLDGLLPFRKTPANVLIRAEEYSPLGLVNAAVDTVKAAKGQISANDAINTWAKGLTGSGLFLLGMWLSNAGILHAGEDEDEQKAAFDRMNGVQPYSLQFGDVNLTIDAFSPAAIPLLMGGQLMQAAGDEGIELKDLEKALTSITEPMIEMSMLQGVNDTLDAIQYADNNLIQLGVNLGLNYLTQGLTNTAAGQIERSFEESRMQTYTDKNSDLPDWLQRTLGKASAKTPGIDYNQIPYINAWGEEEENMTPALGLVYNMLSPGYGDLKEDTPLTRELYRLDKAQGENVFPSTPGKSFKANGETVNMTAGQYVQAAKTKGQTQKRIVEDLIGSRAYRRLSDEDKARAVRKAYEYAWDYTKQEVFDIEISTKWMRGIEGEEAEAILAWVQK